MKTFNHNFKEPLNEDTIKEMNGFIACMSALQKQLELMTGYKPERRMIDAVVLLEMISDTTDVFTPMMTKYGMQLSSLISSDKELNHEAVNQ
jgi:hypothetical protein